MMTVAQVSKRAGVRVRTLHHYDQNGLLKPTEVTAAGYRLYGQAYVHIVHSVSCMILVRRFLPILGIAGLLEMVSF